MFLQRVLFVATLAFATTSIEVMAGQHSTAITGRVVTADTGDPLPHARVTLASSSLDAPVVLTDAEGAFAIPAATGPHRVIVAKTGYLRAEVPATTSTPIEISLHRSGAISGTLTDESGQPAFAVRVIAQAADGADKTIAATNTDDRGEYRLSGLPAGRFIVSAFRLGAAIVNGKPTRPETRYYPGTNLRAEAAPIDVSEGDDADGIDFVSPGLAGVIYGTGALITPMAAAQAALDEPTGSGSIGGRITTMDGRPVPRATVQLSVGPMHKAPTTTTDDNGRYLFTGLAAGRFGLMAVKVGYLGVATGPTHVAFNGAAAERSVTLADREGRDDVDFQMVAVGIITGQVLDEANEPIDGAAVQLLQPRYERGRRRLVPAGPGSLPTDDRGMFRLYGIRPGRYVLTAAPGTGSVPMASYARAYFPGTPNASEAQIISISPGENLTGVAVSLSPTRTFMVSGTLVDSSGEPTSGGTLQLLPSVRSTSIVAVPVGARIERNAFAFANVTPGQYVIRADRGRSHQSMEGEFGTVPVTVTDANVTGLVLQTSAGSSVAGRVTFDTASDAKGPNPSDVEITPLPVDYDSAPAQPASADIHDDWTFEMRGVNGVRRLEVVRTPPGWALEEIRVNGIDATDRPLAFGKREQSLNDVEVVLTNRIAGVKGSVADDRGRPVEGARIVVFSTDRDRWYDGSRFLRLAHTDADGTFTATPLPPGSYYVATVRVVPEEGDDSWQDPAFLESLIARGTSVIVSDGEVKSIALKK